MKPVKDLSVETEMENEQFLPETLNYHRHYSSLLHEAHG